MADLSSKVYDPPISYHCGYKPKMKVEKSVVNFDSMFYSRTNQWTEEGGLDISSGEYTTPYPGTYTLSATFSSDSLHGNYIHVYIRKNGQKMPETRIQSYSSGS